MSIYTLYSADHYPLYTRTSPHTLLLVEYLLTFYEFMYNMSLCIERVLTYTIMGRTFSVMHFYG